MCSRNNCHDLAHYVSAAHKYFVSNSTFVFLSGVHILSSSFSVAPLVISHANGLVFTSLSHSHMATILCQEGFNGFSFINSSFLSLSGLKFINCSSHTHSSALSFINISIVLLNRITVVETKGIGVKFHNIAKLDILSSHFSGNGLGVTNCTLETAQLWHSVSITATVTCCESIEYNIINL